MENLRANMKGPFSSGNATEYQNWHTFGQYLFKACQPWQKLLIYSVIYLYTLQKKKKNY